MKVLAPAWGPGVLGAEGAEPPSKKKEENWYTPSTFSFYVQSFNVEPLYVPSHHPTKYYQIGSIYHK